MTSSHKCAVDIKCWNFRKFPEPATLWGHVPLLNAIGGLNWEIELWRCKGEKIQNMATPTLPFLPIVQYECSCWGKIPVWKIYQYLYWKKQLFIPQWCAFSKWHVFGTFAHRSWSCSCIYQNVIISFDVRNCQTNAAVNSHDQDSSLVK